MSMRDSKFTKLMVGSRILGASEQETGRQWLLETRAEVGRDKTNTTDLPMASWMGQSWRLNIGCWGYREDCASR